MIFNVGKNKNVWVGTLAEFEAEKDTIPVNTYINILGDNVKSVILDDSTISQVKGWSSHNIYERLNDKLNAVVLEALNIASSQVSYTFNDSRITTSSIIDVYDSIFGFTVSNITVTDGKCVLTFPAQSTTHDLKIVVI